VSDVVERWRISNRFAVINQDRLKPLAHTLLPGTPLYTSRRQADVYSLRSECGRAFMLKKFHSAQGLNMAYLAAVRRLLPKEPGFAAGTQRAVLSAQALASGNGWYYATELARWLDGTLLMPRVEGCDWVSVADDVRAARLDLPRSVRMTLARSLAYLVERLEACRCSHRDLSGSNIYINLDTQTIELIDFDSLRHPSVVMPAVTTCGTAGYIAPFVWNTGNCAATTWCEFADRFTLAVLVAELLVVDVGAPWSGDGGLFDQAELAARRGAGIDWARSRLRAGFPAALALFDAALASANFKACPTPGQWQAKLTDVRLPDRPAMANSRWHGLRKLVGDVFFEDVPMVPAPAPPRLSEIPVPTVRLPVPLARVVSLPPDPWAGGNGAGRRRRT
jgi:hypothetical protein